MHIAHIGADGDGYVIHVEGIESAARKSACAFAGCESARLQVAPPPRPVRRDHRAKLDELQIGECAAEHERELVAREHVTCSGEYDEGLGLPLIGSESGHFGSGRLLQT